ncbi:MAG: DUF3108 domain-containing protein [Burkholderiaceae bacterium]
MNTSRRRLAKAAVGVVPTFLLTTGAAAPPVASVLWPGAKPFSVDYDGYYESDSTDLRIASGRLRFEPLSSVSATLEGQDVVPPTGLAPANAGGYRVSLLVDSLLATLRYESVGWIDADGLHPLGYREERKLPFRSLKRREVRYLYDDRAPSAPLANGVKLLRVPTGAQDRLSIIVHLCLMARANPGLFVDGQRMNLPFAGFSDVRDARMRVGRIEPVARGPLGLKARRIERANSDRDDLGIEMWLEPTAAPLPVALRLSESSKALYFVVDRG